MCCLFVLFLSTGRIRTGDHERIHGQPGGSAVRGCLHTKAGFAVHRDENEGPPKGGRKGDAAAILVSTSGNSVRFIVMIYCFIVWFTRGRMGLRVDIRRGSTSLRFFGCTVLDKMRCNHWTWRVALFMQNMGDGPSEDSWPKYYNDIRAVRIVEYRPHAPPLFPTVLYHIVVSDLQVPKTAIPGG